MGNVCCSEERYERHDRDEGFSTDINQFLGSEYKKSLSINQKNLFHKASSILELNDTVQKQLSTLKYFIPQDAKESIPESFRMKYIQQLLELRASIFEKMKAHTDKYNGSCVHKERIKEFGYNDGQFEIFEKDENTQEERSDKGSKLFEDISKITLCQPGRQLNSQMNQAAEYLWRLGYMEGDQVSLYIKEGSYELKSLSFDSETSELKHQSTKAFFIMLK